MAYGRALRHEIAMKNLFAAAIVGGLAYGCSPSSPTTPIAPNSAFMGEQAGAAVIDAATIERQTQQLYAMSRNVGLLRSLSADEDFTCTNVEEVRARFSDPGYIDRLNVGLFLKFIGIPAGAKTLRVWWDYDRAFDQYQDVLFDSGDINPENGSLFDIETVIEHSYGAAGTYVVRVELILEGETGNCARNREIVVTPESFDHVVTFKRMANCVNSPIDRSGLLFANITPAIPTGTTYTVRARIDGVGTVAPSTTIAIFGGPVLIDFVPRFDLAPPPNEFTVSITASAPHSRHEIAGQILSFFGPPTSINIRLLSLNVPGRTVGLVGTVGGSCP